jgi:hypothetical protein
MKKLTALALVFIALAAFVYLYEIVGEEGREDARELEESLFRIEEDEIAALSIARTGTDLVRLRKSADKWVLEAPIEAPADEGTVDLVLRSIQGAKRVKIFEDTAGQLEAYGLGRPRVSLSVEVQEVTQLLELGDMDYTGSQVYARFEGEETVYLTAASLLSSLEKDLIDWRNKDAMAFDLGKVEAIQIEREKDRVELVKRDETWLLESPVSEKADDGKVSSLLSLLESAKAETFVMEQAEELGEYGLEDPRVIVRVREAGEEAWQQLEVGSKAGDAGGEDETWFARDPRGTSVFTLKKDLLDGLEQDVWEFRGKDVIDLKQDEVQRLALKQVDGEIVVRLENYDWIVESPEDFKDRKAQAYKIWYPIDDIEFASIDEQGGSIPDPDVEILVTLVDGTTRTYRFQQQGEAYLAVKVDTGQKGTISSEDFNKLKVTPEEIVGD